MRWTVHGSRSIYTSDWVGLDLVDVEVPGGDRFDHHVVRMAADASGTVVEDADRGLLLLWRHRFISDTWGYEVPAGRIDEGETAEEAAHREVLEETGWRPGPLRPLCSYHPVNGSVDLRFHVFLADGATHEGEPTDPSESERVEWVAADRVPGLLAGGQVVDGLSLTALLWWACTRGLVLP